MSVYKYRDSLGRLWETDTQGIEIGDYVKISDKGHYYPSFKKLFNFFWGTDNSAILKYYDHDYGIWKVINIAFIGTLVFHIRNREGKNVAISRAGIQKIKFHSRNRSFIHPREIAYISTFGGDVFPHTYKEKLYKRIEE